MLKFFKSKRDKKDSQVFNAAEYGDWQTVAFFLERDYPVNYPDPDTQMTLLEFAEKQNEEEVIAELKKVYGALDKAEREIQAITFQFQYQTLQTERKSGILRPKPLKPTAPQRHVRFVESPLLARATEQLDKFHLEEACQKQAKSPRASYAIRN